MAEADVQIRAFTASEWPQYKAVRLKALENDPMVFTARLAEERALPDEKWQKDLADKDGAVFGVFHQGAVVGMTAIGLDRANPGAAKMWGSWLAPEWRRKGIARRLYQARIDWAKAHPAVKKITVSHRKSNAVSKRCNQRCGFKFTHAAETVWHNGQKETEFFYELGIK